MDPRRWQEIQATFDQLVELDVAERSSRLATLGSTDPELRAALELMLAADAAAEAQLGPLDAALLAPTAGTPDLFGLRGRTVSHFEVREPIGAGGMGVVYSAQDTRLRRPVALKFLLPFYNLDTAAKVRFIREAKSGAALDHPNLCTIYEVGTSDDGQLFMAMALYAGETLKSRLERDKTLPVSAALTIARQVAGGLEGAHAAGIVHRDLKPGNIMLLPDGSVKILDFGLAKARDQSVTQTGARFGTVGYMAPEQVRGEAVDGRTDLWALGVVLYEMLSGVKPFAADEEIAVAHAIIHDEPVPPGTLRTDVPVIIEDLVLRLLQKDPGARYPSATAFLTDLTAAEKEVGGSTQWLGRQWRRTRRQFRAKRRGVAAVGAALVFVALTYGAIARTTSDPIADPVVAPARTAIAVLPFENLTSESPHAYFAGGLHGEVLTQLSRVAALKVISRTSVMGYASSKTPRLRQIANELGVGSVVEGSVQVVSGRLRVNVQLIDAATDAEIWAERYDRTLDDAFAIQNDIAQSIVAAVGVALSSDEARRLAAAPTVNAEAYRLYLQALEYGRRPGMQRQNVEIIQQFLDRALALEPDWALALAARSELHGAMHWFGLDPSPARLARQREDAEAALRLAPDLPEAHTAMGVAHYWGQRDYRRAAAEFAIAQRGLPNDLNLWTKIGAVHRRLGNWDEVAHALDNVMRLDPRNADVLFDLGGGTNRILHRYPEALRALDGALSLAPDHPEAALWKGEIYALWQGQLDTLRAVLNRLPKDAELGFEGTRTAQRARLLLWERHADSLLQLLTVADIFQGKEFFLPSSLYAAWAYQLRGDRPAARAAFDSARVLLDSVLLELPDDWRVHAARGLAMAGLGRPQEALREARWLERSPVYREDAFTGPLLAEDRARILVQAGETVMALNEVERLLAGPSLVSVHTLRLNPLWDPIREHPRFRALLMKYERSST